MDSPICQEPKIQKKQSIDRLDDKNQHEDDNKGQVSRRSRKDTDGRDFKCGCGKKYLSYPALYTHIKTKHDGQQPEGTVKYSTTVPTKKTKSKIQQQHLTEVYSLVKRQDLRVLDLIGQKYYGITPLSCRIKNKILSKDLTEAYNSLLKNTNSPLKLSRQHNLQQHLIVYLIGVGEYVCQKLHEQYQWFARSVRECYYQIGNQVYTKCFSKKQGGIAYIPKFRVEQVKYFPIISDFYIRFFLPYEYMQLNINLMELILIDFCQWLLRRESTLIEIMMHKEYRLNIPLEFQEDKNQKQPKNKDQIDSKCDRSDLEDMEVDAREEKRQQNHQHQHQHQQIISYQSDEDQNQQPLQQKVENISTLKQQSILEADNVVNLKLQQKDSFAALSLQVQPAAESSQQIINEAPYEERNESEPAKLEPDNIKKQPQVQSQHNL